MTDRHGLQLEEAKPAGFIYSRFTAIPEVNPLYDISVSFVVTIFLGEADRRLIHAKKSRSKRQMPVTVTQRTSKKHLEGGGGHSWFEFAQYTTSDIRRANMAWMHYIFRWAKIGGHPLYLG